MTSARLIEAFNTHNLADDKVRRLMTARDSQRKAILVAVDANLTSTRGQRQHVALHGPRGFGKSFMTRVIELDVAARVDEGAAAHYLLLPEEQHNLARSPDALLRFFATRMKAEGDAWQEAAFTWPSGDPQQRWREAEAELDAAIDARFGAGKGLVIAVVENFDLLLREVFAHDGAEERLRKWMTRAGNRVMLFVTTTLPVDTDYERALFQAFKPVSLTAWSEDDCIAYFNRRRELAGAPPLDLSTEAKARAVANFIGGNPRLAQLLSNVLEADEVLSVAALLNELADELADYYRNRIDDLAPLARGLLDALIRGGEPCSASALAKRVGTDQKTIARAFALLTNADIVSGQRASDSKEKLFSVRDRVFVHFYRLRYGGVPRDASPLVHIVELLQRFYETPKERLVQANYYLDRGHLAWALGMQGKHADDLEVTEEALGYARQGGSDWLVSRALKDRAWSLGQLGRHQEAIEAASRAASLARRCDNFSDLTASLTGYLQAAGHVGGGDAIAVMEEVLGASRRQEGDEATPRIRPWLYLDDLFASVTRTQNWDELLTFAERERSVLSEHLDIALSGIAIAVSDLAREEGRAVAFAAISPALKTLPRLEVALNQPSGADVVSMTITVVGQVLVRCDNDGLLRDVADLLERTHGADADNIVATLRSAATFHAAGRSEASLERVDPDTASLIRRLWLPDVPE